MKVIIAGSRDFNNYEMLESKVSHLLSLVKPEDTEVVSGGCRGVDKLGERYAKEHGIKVKVFPAFWHTYGKSAGPRRNKQMAEYGDALIAFWDHKSKGTANMIAEAREHGLIVRVIGV